MFVRRTGIDLQLHVGLAAERVLRKHPLDRLFDDALRVLRHQLRKLLVAVAARIERIMIIRLLLHALAGHLDLLGVDDNDEIACIDMRRKSRFVLAAKDGRDARGQTAHGLPVGIYQMPLPIDFALLCGAGNPPVFDGIIARRHVVFL